MNDLESDSIVASCDCLTKTNDIQFHKPGCKYRLIVERDQARKCSYPAGLRNADLIRIEELARERDMLLKSLQDIVDSSRNCQALKILPPTVDELQRMASNSLAYSPPRLVPRDAAQDLVNALDHIAEYWNGGEGSAVDAAEEARNTATAALEKWEARRL